MPWTNKKTHTSPKTDPMPWENKGRKAKETQKTKDPEMTREEMRAYFEKYKDDPVPLGEYKHKDMKEIVKIRTQETGMPFEQHHVWPQAQSKEISKATGKQYKNNVVIPLPRKIHQKDNREFMHERNEQNKPQNPRESLAQGVNDTRNGMLEAGCDRAKTNDACLDALRKIKSENPGGFEGKIPPKPKGE
ncbi:hypothetical protein HE1_00021 [Holospora elegans E1]|uniref:Uncharacterized protein n=2 Tax=Holospora TaxID=44747 RepID=A0A023DX15_9PROT|nr:hypothetical protein HE1_00021 [Holospora elegans E1]